MILHFFVDDDESLNSSSVEQLSRQLRVLRKTRRQDRYNAYGIRSKYVVIPNQIKEARTHSIPSPQSQGTVYVPPSIGFLHHYRFGCQKQEWEIANCDTDPTHVDRTVHKYKERLLLNVKRIIHQLSDQCKLTSLIRQI